MLISAIKSDAFKPSKRVVFKRWKVLKRGRYCVFVLGYCHKYVFYKVFTQNI